MCFTMVLSNFYFFHFISNGNFKIRQWFYASCLNIFIFYIVNIKVKQRFDSFNLDLISFIYFFSLRWKAQTSKFFALVLFVVYFLQLSTFYVYMNNEFYLPEHNHKPVSLFFLFQSNFQNKISNKLSIVWNFLFLSSLHWLKCWRQH